MKLRLGQIAEIRNSLNTLGSKSLPIAYEIAKNSRICDKILKEAEEILKDLQKTYFDKDETGELKTYTEDGKQIIKISDPAKLREYNVEAEKFEKDLHEVEFSTIKASKLEGYSIEANTLIPLLDAIIID